MFRCSSGGRCAVRSGNLLFDGRSGSSSLRVYAAHMALRPFVHAYTGRYAIASGAILTADLHPIATEESESERAFGPWVQCRRPAGKPKRVRAVVEMPLQNAIRRVSWLRGVSKGRPLSSAASVLSPMYRRLHQPTAKHIFDVARSSRATSRRGNARGLDQSRTKSCNCSTTVAVHAVASGPMALQ